ncbi:MAG: dTDP-4-dehydrorhamnose reductase [Actinomycetota bacterium]|nr:dTDP-4-dehydrorhamnose reductase [Actinomycetota bacterium]
MRVLITGAGGQLGTDLQTVFAAAPHHSVVALGHGDLDVADRDQVHQVVGTVRPELVIHAAAWTAVDACETDPDRAWAVNALGSRYVAAAAAAAGAHLVYLSTDYVFDGSSAAPYREWDTPNPQSIYGRSKRAGEEEVLQRLPAGAVVRTSWVCGPHGSNMVKTILRLAGNDGRLAFVNDQHGCPTFTDDLAAMIYRIGVERRSGIHHVTNQGATTWYQFARDTIAAAGGDPTRVDPISTADLRPPRPAPRPANSVLDNTVLRLGGLGLLPDHHQPLERTVAALLGAER